MPSNLHLLTAIGWSLLYSIWQMGALWVLFYIVAGNNSRFSPAVRHDLILTAVFINSGWFIYSFILFLKEPAATMFSGWIPVLPMNRWMPYLSLIYLLIIVAHLFQFFFRWLEQIKYKSESIKIISTQLQLFADRQVRLLGINKKVRVLLSQKAETAATSGFLKPLILLPVSLVSRLTTEQLEAILVHELLHIRRNDFLINIFLCVFRYIFFFNPFAHLMFQAIARERELACDDGVLDRNYAPALYADALFRLEKSRQVVPDFSLAADGKKPWFLLERISRVLGNPVKQKINFNPIPWIAVFISILFTAMSLQPVLLSRVPAAIQKNMALRKDPPEIKKSQPSVARIEVRTKKVTGLSSDRKPVLIEFPQLENVTENVNLEETESTPPVSFSIDPILPSPEVFSNNNQPFVFQSDSMLRTRLKEAIALTLVKKTQMQQQLKRVIFDNRNQLIKMESKNRIYFQMHEKNFRPLLQKLKILIDDKKQIIDSLQFRLRISEEEIIHI